MTCLPTDAVTRRTAARLADGREIIYFDETRRRTKNSHRHPRPARRRADLPAALRRAARRMGRASPATGRPAPTTRRPTPVRCARHARGNCQRDSLSRIRCRGLREPLPVVRRQPRAPPPAPHRRSTQLPGNGPLRGGVLHQRPRRRRSPSLTAASGCATVLAAWIDRTEAMSAIPGRRSRCSASRTEAWRSASPWRTRTARSTGIRSSPRARRRCCGRSPPTGRRPAATCSRDLLDGEIADGSRIVAQNEHWVAFVPFAARWPLEVHLYPRRQGAGPAGARTRAAGSAPGRSTWRCCTGWRASSTTPSRPSRRGTRPRCTSAGTTSGCTWSCSPSAAQWAS